MKERDYIQAQALTRLRIACDILGEVSLFDVPAPEKDRFVEARKALFEVRNAFHSEMPIEESP